MSENNGVRYYPVDVTALVKGQVMDIPELERVLNTTKDDPRWSLRVLALRHKIERQRSKLGLPILTMRIDHGKLVVCDDSNAACYNRTMGKRGIRRFKRATYRNIAVDATKLTDEERETHGRTIMRQAMMLVAVRSNEHRALAIVGPPARVTPKMIQAAN